MEVTIAYDNRRTEKTEHETIEYKQDIPKDKDKYLKTAVAFANAAGGRIIFGVENNTWEVTGFSDDEVFAKMDAITNSIFDACAPSAVPIMSIEEIDGKKIIVATIRPGMAKPYYLRKEGMMEGTYTGFSIVLSARFIASFCFHSLYSICIFSCSSGESESVKRP